jgi:hypothetical protein
VTETDLKISRSEIDVPRDNTSKFLAILVKTQLAQRQQFATTLLRKIELAHPTRLTTIAVGAPKTVGVNSETHLPVFRIIIRRLPPRLSSFTINNSS